VSIALYGSWTQPQAQGLLNLYQTNLTLQALAWQPNTPEQQTLREQLFGTSPVQDAARQYQTVIHSIEQSQSALAPRVKPAAPQPGAKTSPAATDRSPEPVLNNQQLETLDTLHLRLGILEASLQHPEPAQTAWDAIAQAPFTSPRHRQIQQTATVLTGLWQQPPRIDPAAETLLKSQLRGWFQLQSLQQLYTLQQRTADLPQLQQGFQALAINAIARLGLVVAIPSLGSLIGLGVLIVWGLRQWFARTKAADPVAPETSADLDNLPERLGSNIPWPIETVWFTMLLWFMGYFLVSLVIPLGLQIVGISLDSPQARTQTLVALCNYSGLIAAGLGIIYAMTRSFARSPWQLLPIQFRSGWVGWAIGGYLAALPLVLLVSVLNQKLLQDQGGGNPLLEIIVQSQDWLTATLLWAMVAVLAPLFEETVFRGFLLTSLNRYLPTAGAIGLSAILFALAHLNAADLLPLTVLGVVLGTLYHQSRNLLSSILLHSLWNTASFVGLIILSGGQ
jgi:membrane protease YdiL (CAAX protease family)